MVSKRRRTSAALFVGALLFGGAIAVTSVDAQKSTRKRTTRTSKTTPRPTPPPSTEPGVVSRADDFPIELLQGTPVQPQQQGDSLIVGTVPSSDATIEELRERLAKLEASKKNDSAEIQKRLATNLDILTKAEQRVDALRKQQFEMIEKESSVKGRLDQIDNDLRPEAIERVTSMTGSLRPEELREQRRRSLMLEKQNLTVLLTEVQKNKANLDSNVLRAESLVERLRLRLEKDIDSALKQDEEGLEDPVN